MKRFCVAACAALMMTSVAHAQAPDPMARLEAAAATIEQSTFNQALPLFGDLFWGFQPQQFEVPLRGMYVWDPSEGLDRESMFNPNATFATAALKANMDRLMVYARVKCRELTPAQVGFLVGFAQARYQRLLAASTVRAADIARAMQASIAPVSGVALAPQAACARTANAGGATVTVSTDLLLIALFSAMYVDEIEVIVPDRVVAQTAAAIPPFQERWDSRRGGRIFDRIHGAPVWTNVLRVMQVSNRLTYVPLRDLDRRAVEEMSGRDMPQCRSQRAQCRTRAALTIAYMSSAKVDMLFGEQVDFILAHELGHHALGHVSQPIGTCAEENAREAAADRFAVALMRPPEGLFNRPETYDRDAVMFAATDNRFASGLDLFMAQSHRLALLTDGDNCAYPPFRDRRAAVRAFEKQAWPR